MGGFLSGRRGWRGKCEHRHRVDVRQLKKWGYLRDGAVGSLSWSREGRQTGSIGFRVRRCFVHFHYRWRHGDHDDWRDAETAVGLQTTPCHLGGARHWFVCRCNRRCAIIYVNGPSVGCRECLGLAYASQSEDEVGRAWMRVHDLQRRLGMPDDELGWCYQPRRPKGMHRTTYERLRDQIIADLILIEELFASSTAKLVARLHRHDQKARRAG